MYDPMVHEYLFWQPSLLQANRSMPTTVHNLISGCGFSGTDACFLEIASGLAQHGNQVSILSGGPEQVLDGMKYLSPLPSDLDMSDLSKVDVLVVAHILEDMYELVDLMKRLTHPRLQVFIWCQCIWSKSDVDSVRRICSRACKVSIVGVSDFVEKNMQHCIGKCTSYFKIPNGIIPSMFCSESSGVREKLSFVFTASFERGGAVARQVHALLQSRGLPMGNMYVYSYCDQEYQSLSKLELVQRMHECEYMVYPLTLSNSCVHHDTFGCVVLEAMACGVLVVTWDVACMRGVYGDLITLVKPPAYPRYDPTAKNGQNPAMLEQRSIASLADAVQALESLTYQQREHKRECAREWAISQTRHHSVELFQAAVAS